jgi:adenylate kinase family enzyme
MRILVTGAAGSGTSTLGRALADQLNAAFLDADDFFWLPTTPPYRERRATDDRLRQAMEAVALTARCVLAGSVMNWGEELESSFTLIIFLQVETEVRLERLRKRELERFGHVDPAFLQWAAEYDEGPPEGRSLAKHNEWLKSRKCPVVRLVGLGSVGEQLKALRARA